MTGIVNDRTDIDYADVLDRAFDSQLRALVDQAEAQQHFPRDIFDHLGAAGVLAAKWGLDTRPDLGKLIQLAERLGGLGCGGVAVGVSLHDSAIAILRRFGRTPYLSGIADAAIEGRVVLCIAASELDGGSDLQSMKSTVSQDKSGYRLRGHKKFASLSPIADYALLVVRSPESDAVDATGNLALFVVPMDQLEVGASYRTVGAHCLDTAPLTFDTWVTAEALVARPGTGLAAISWGLAHERLSIAAQVVGACDLALGVTVARMQQRHQFGASLFDHQALRLRIADLRARTDVLRWALQGIATSGRSLDLRTASAMKVTAARHGEELLSECMHLFGGMGYLHDESPLGRWWQDMKLARVGGGTDEVLWELVAATMLADDHAYQQLMKEPS